MFGSKIKNRVTKVLNERIERAEALHAEAVQKHTEVFKERVATAKAQRDIGIESHAGQMVESIIGKV